LFTLHCRDAGFDCAGVVTGNTREEVMRQATVHAAQVHLVQITPEMEAEISTLIRDSPEVPAAT
jgi:predicted small metal-binding protein